MTDLNWQREALVEAAPDGIARVLVSSFGTATAWKQPGGPRPGDCPPRTRCDLGRTNDPRRVHRSITPPNYRHDRSSTVELVSQIRRAGDEVDAAGASIAVQGGQSRDGRSGGSPTSIGPTQGADGREARLVAECSVLTGPAIWSHCFPFSFSRLSFSFTSHRRLTRTLPSPLVRLDSTKFGGLANG